MTSRPNLLLITTDQQHYDTLGIVNPRIRTPHLDRLCREGMNFSRAYCPNPTCTPTRSTLLTGLMPSLHGAWTLGTRLDERLPTLPGLLSEAGYATSLVGKAHFQPLRGDGTHPSIECQPLLRDLDFWRGFHGPWYGFGHVEIARNHADEGHVGAHYAVWMEEQGFDHWPEYFQLPGTFEEERRAGFGGSDSRHWTLPENLHYTHWTAERTCVRLDEAARNSQPFFLWCSFQDPHPPYLVPEPWASLYDPGEMVPGRLTPGEHRSNPPHFHQAAVEGDPAWWAARKEGQGTIHGGSFQGGYPEDELRRDIACYYGMISFLDDRLGRILDRIDALGLAENTLVVFTSDHGHFLGQHGLRAKAIHHYEDLLRVPLIVRWPGQVPAGGLCPHLMNLVDLPRTFLGAAGLPVPPTWQGVDQRATWAGGDPARTWSITENHHGYTRFHLHSFVTERYKITVYRDGEEGELFDLREDPGELRNLWEDPASAQLKSRLLLDFLRARMAEEPMAMPRMAGARIRPSALAWHSENHCQPQDRAVSETA